MSRKPRGRDGNKPDRIEKGDVFYCWDCDGEGYIEILSVGKKQVYFANWDSSRHNETVFWKNEKVPKEAFEKLLEEGTKKLNRLEKTKFLLRRS